MSKQNDDYLSFPIATNRDGQLQKKEAQGLTERQMDTVVNAGADLAKGAVDCAKTAFEIWKIRTQTDGEKEKIEAQTAQLVVQLGAEIEKMKEERARISEQGWVTTEIIRAMHSMMRDIPDFDDKARTSLIETLPKLIEQALGNQSKA